jgi:phosphoribosyl-AMP cyclohydrolase
MNDSAQAMIPAWVARLRDTYPRSIAVMLRGSRVWSGAGPHSDIDFDVLLDGEPYEAWPMFLERDTSGRMIHVSVAVQDLASWLAEGDEPVDWAFGFGVRSPVKLLWAKDAETTALLDRPWRESPPADPEVEDFVEGYGKVLNAFGRNDDVGMRQAAQNMAKLAPTLLRLVNDEVWPGTRREALEAALGFANAPEGYRQAMLTCLGLSDRATTPDEMVAAARLLAEGVIRVVRDHGQFEPDYPAGDPMGLLKNGMIESYIAQMGA